MRRMASTTAAPPGSTESSEPLTPDLPSRRRPRPPVVLLLFPLPAALLYGLFVLWPVVSIFWLSLFQWSGFGPQRFIGFENFASLFSDPLFRMSLWRSLLWEVGALLVPTLLALGIALLL